MNDLWILLYDSDTGRVWGEVVRSHRIEAMMFALWMRDAAGGPPRYHAAVVPAWMPVPELTEVLGSARPVYTRWTGAPGTVQPTSSTLAPSSTVGDDPIGEQFIAEWMEVFQRYRPRLEAMRKRVADCGLTEESPELHATFAKCIQDAVGQFNSNILVDPDPAVEFMLDCVDQDLTEHGCEKAGEKKLKPWMIYGLAAGGVVLVGTGIYFATRK